MSDTWPIDSIIEGKRFRRDFGDLNGLARDIDEIGFLHPIPIRPDGLLIAGARRLAAAKLAGWTEIPVTVIERDFSIVRGEFAENAYRKDFTLSELVAIGQELERIESAQAKARMVAAHASPGKLPEQDKGDARDKIASRLGVSGRTYEKACEIVAAADAEPERFGHLRDDMDRSGKVNGVFKRLRVAKQAERIRAEPPPLPTRGPYRCAVVDFPWPYEPWQQDPSQRAALPYPTMGIEQICATREWLPGLLHADAIVWLWCTNFHLIRYAAPVLDALGLSERSILTWVKSHFGTGDLLRSQTEHCIMAVRGKPTVTLTNESTVLFAPVPRGHSSKPPEFYDLVERLCPASRYADFFSRYCHNDKWHCHVDQAPPMAAAPSPRHDEQQETLADDLSIPPFLRRPLPARDANGGAP